MSIKSKQILKTIFSYILIFGLAFGCAKFITSNYSIAQVCGNSMEPTLQDGDLLIVNKNAIPEDQDIIVLRSAGNDMFKNDFLVKRYYAENSTDTEIWVEGDNKADSLDSRDAGLLDRDNIDGVVIFNLSGLYRKITGN